MTVPDVSVVVIGFNDAARLSRAIASVQRQTLRNLEIIVVDDASTDDTADVVARICAEDARIRYDRLPENSGGCSAPRNRGMELARAHWVMFCDSDDEYERHACKNLLMAAERLDADVVCGAADRIDIHTGRAKRWKPELHDVEQVADGLEMLPELLADTISVNKIYRRSLLADNGITFPLGLLFEDQLFTLEALASARRVAAIPQMVYRWYVDSVSEEPSITQRRNEARNVDSRIEVNRRIDSFLAERDLLRVREIKDLKFLRHDVYLYLSSILEVDDDTAKALMDSLRPYVESVNLAPAWQLRPALRVAIYHLLVDDLEGIRAAMRFVRWASVVDVPIVERDGQQMWACGHLDAGMDAGGFAARAWLDVTQLRLLDVPFSQRRYCHHLHTITVDEGVLSASGSTLDYDGSLADAEALELRFGLGSQWAAVQVPATWTGWDGDRRAWRAYGVAEDVLGRPLGAKDRGSLSLAVGRGALINVTGVRAPSTLPSGVIAFPGDLRSGEPDLLVHAAGENGSVSWSATRSPGRKPRSHSSWTARLSRFLRKEIVRPVLGWLGTVLPPRDLVIFDTGQSRPANAEAKALGEHLHASYPTVEQVWVHIGRPLHVPAHAQPIEQLSLRHQWVLARARWRVDDGTATVGLRRRRSTRTVFPTDGVPIHRLALDDPSVLGSGAAVREIRARSRQWSVVLSASSSASRTVAGAYRFDGDVRATGIARLDNGMDVLAHGHEARSRLRAALDLDLDRPVILYAPTGRNRGRGPWPPLIDLEQWVGEVGERAYLIIRGHPSERLEISTRWRSAVRDISDSGRVGDYLVACDLFVSDYSSTIGDAALARRPIVLFQPDRDEYVDRLHGLYFDLASVAPIATTSAALITHVHSWLDDPEGWNDRHAGAVRTFAAANCGPDDAMSAARAVKALLGDEVVR